MQFWNDSSFHLLGLNLCKNIHKSSFHPCNVLFSIHFYILCVLKVDFFVTYGPSVTTVAPKHLGLIALWFFFCIETLLFQLLFVKWIMWKSAL